MTEKKISRSFLVLTIHKIFLKLIQLRLYGLYLNERYMKTIRKQKNINHLVERIKHKANELEQETLQSMIDGVSEEASRYVVRWTIFGSLNMVFRSTYHALSNKKNSAFHLPK